MTRISITPMLAVALLGCEPDEQEPGSGPPPGVLEYESRLTEIYRDDRRVDVIFKSESSNERSCGILTDRAFADLQGTIGSLDTTADYDFGLDGEDCVYGGGPSAEIHLAGFERSPFSCDEFCCQADLRPVPQVYLHVLNNLTGAVLEIDGEPYVAIEPDQPCP